MRRARKTVTLQCRKARLESTRRRVRRTLAAAAVLAAATNTLIPVPAQAVTYSPPTGAIFNIPDGVGGTTAQQRRWLDTVTNMTDATPAGQRITITMLSIYDPEVITALQRADHRGVNVRIVMSAVKVSASTAKLRDDLNDGSNPGSWFKSCRESCNGPSGIGVAHSKIFTVSNFNGPKGQIMDTTIIGTGNLTSGGSKTSFNSWHIIPNNRALYVGATERDTRDASRPAHQPSPLQSGLGRCIHAADAAARKQHTRPHPQRAQHHAVRHHTRPRRQNGDQGGPVLLVQAPASASPGNSPC